MSFAFIDPAARVAVTDGEGTVFIVGKLTKRQRGLVQQELLSLQIKQTAGGSGNGSGRPDEEAETVVDAKVSAHLHELALLKAAVVDWEGPSFRFANGAKVPCNSHWIERIDSDLPIWQSVLVKVDELNTPRTAAPEPLPVEAPAPKAEEGGNSPNGQPASNTLPVSATDGSGV